MLDLVSKFNTTPNSMTTAGVLLRSSKRLYTQWLQTNEKGVLITPSVYCEELPHGLVRRGLSGTPTIGSNSRLRDPNAPLAQSLQRIAKQLRGLPFRFGRALPDGREELVVLGSGWASLYLLSQIDPTKYKVTVVSPRPYFVFTPLLTSALGGVLSLRSIMEPIRNKLHFGSRKVMQYIQATAEDIDIQNRKVDVEMVGGTKVEIPFDKLVVAVGSETNTFGIPGVKEHCSFLKELEDVREIRLRVFSAFETASQPNLNEEQRRQALSFVIVGGGPAGVEAAAELNDLIREDMKTHFPELVDLCQVTVVEMLPNLLPMFHSTISQFTAAEFSRTGIRALMQHRVTKVDASHVHLVDKDSKPLKIPYSFCLWASGVGQVALSKKLMANISEQKGNRVMRVRPSLEIVGAPAMYGMGDCAWLTPASLAEKSDSLFQDALQSHAGPSAHFLKTQRQKLLRRGFVQLHPTQCAEDTLASKKPLTKEEFKQLLESIDKGYHPPIPTAQMARQAGAYLGYVLNNEATSKRRGHTEYAPLPFAPRYYGAMSYVGDNKAIVELTRRWNQPKPAVRRYMGYPANFLWHSYYWMSQTSKYNR
eukprot:Protomagalhaensia_sp_Gyna_25__4805@NODE_48_length_6292_cov_422_749400_g36_i0_p2_GENE_NODE_48_length_6292_cov_422_749400_g36_i0NODE_48_length_6292_cov_422_749400_g36_i0_p2_ORF_typecomplete_len592_score79_32Pyr_redox_2/PF07992_14/2_6e44Pyr_redox/PF00070_27/96Pyr_redox/PF00070_27/2_3e13Pyr_redox_3/PF13738_6/1_2e03Pyr_redox_3/PF13738_6/3_6Pyr_redox_3/PF13738_6/0_28HI0933_like/PF03486_14/13HI0933_like/PF03486_14/0_64HI0933_like/PF03486_14/14Lycopene_cycl/PF05834_12/5_1Lycopene_cycl/PF05834_12/3_5e03L